MFTEKQIIAGIKLAQQWYEGHRFDEMGPEQILEAIERAPAEVEENPNQHELFHSCQAQRVNDQMICGPCGLTWDIDDPEPPVCRKGK